MTANKKKEKEKPRVCYFCLWNPPTTEIHKGTQVLHSCRHCFSIMMPLVDSKESGVWGWNIAALRPIHPESVKFQKLPLRKCPYCHFQNVHQQSMAHHLKLTHRPNHTYAENLQPETSKQDWLKKVGHRW